MVHNFTALRLARILSGRRLLDAANAIGLTESTLSRIELGDVGISPRRIARLAEFYSLPETMLLGREPITVLGRPPRLGA